MIEEGMKAWHREQLEEEENIFLNGRGIRRLESEWVKRLSDYVCEWESDRVICI